MQLAAVPGYGCACTDCSFEPACCHVNNNSCEHTTCCHLWLGMPHSHVAGDHVRGAGQTEGVHAWQQASIHGDGEHAAGAEVDLAARLAWVDVGQLVQGHLDITACVATAGGLTAEGLLLGCHARVRLLFSPVPAARCLDLGT
jgi:hypothetical protein